MKPPVRPEQTRGLAPDDRLRPGAHDAVNPGGDVPFHDTAHIRCKGCGVAFRVGIPDAAPVHAKARCPRCEYVNEAKTRDEAMDTIESHLEEGEFQARMRRRKSFDMGSIRRQNEPREVVGVKLGGKITSAFLIKGR